MPQRKLLERQERVVYIPSHGHEAAESLRASRNWYPGAEMDIQAHAERVQAEMQREGRWAIAEGNFEAIPTDVLARTQGAAMRLLYGRESRYKKGG